MPFLKRVAIWMKKEIVFTVIFCLTVVSMFLVPPSAQYTTYIDWNTIFILFSLMTVVAGLADCGLFSLLGNKLCDSVRQERTLYAVLVFLCFFSSMLITNDVALLTFVPFTVALLGTQKQGRLVLIIVLQTIAANAGSMLTPIGNPQNLFLFSQMNTTLGDFLLTMLPCTVASGLMLALAILLFPMKNTAQEAPAPGTANPQELKDAVNPAAKSGRIKIAVFIMLFAISVAAVLHMLPSVVAAICVLVATSITSRKVLLRVDYMLLLTFICFFVFTGNIAAIPEIHGFLQARVANAEFAGGIIVSQVISNVPATLMLFPFSSNLKELLLGVNLGGLGTLVGSLASLISFRLYMRTEGARAGRFLATFTLLNVVFLLLLVALEVVVF